MNKKMTKINEVASFTNNFAKGAQLAFNTSGQFKILLAIVGQIDSTKKGSPMSGLLSLEQIQHLTKDDGYKRSGSVKQRVQERIKKMMQRNTVTLKTRTGGLEAYNVFIEHIEPKEIDGTFFYEWKIHEKMRPYVTGLIENFVQIALPKTMKSAHAIRFLILALAHHNRHKKHVLNGVTKLEISILELKRILNIEGRYKAFDNLRRRVIEPIVSDINKSGFLFVQHYEFTKTGRKITGVKFCFQDAKFTDISEPQKQIQPLTNDDTRAKEADILKLTKAELTAFEFLEKRLVYGAIALKQIVKKMPSSECVGYEDLYIKNAWSAFESKTKIQNASAETKAKLFVTWWKKGAFHSSENKNFTNTLEQTIAQKKQQSAEVQANREEAKNMTNAEFEKLQQEGKNREKAEPENKINVVSASPSQSKKEKRGGGFTTLGNVLSSKIIPKKEEEKKNKPPFDYIKWQQENPEEYKQVIAEKWEAYETLFKDFDQSIQEKKKTIDKLVLSECQHRYEQA